MVLLLHELIALGEVVGTESRGISINTIAALPSISYKAQERDGGTEQCVICRLEFDDGETLTALSCKYAYHPECINNWLQINKEPYQLVGSAISDPLDDYKKAVAGLIDEYFSTGDVQVASTDLKDPGTSEYHPYFVKRLVFMAMDRHDKEKEMASVLLLALYADVINTVHISQGFVLLLKRATFQLLIMQSLWRNDGVAVPMSL